jgi:ATP-binding cassette subfamily B protein
MILTPLLYVVTVMFSRWARPAYLETRRLSDQMVRRLAETIEGIQVVKVFGRERQEEQRFSKSNEAVRNQQQSIFRYVSRFTPMVDLLNHLNLAVLMAYGAILIGRQEISLGDLIVFAGLLQQFARRASDMANIVNTLQQSLTGARRVFEVLDQPLEVEEAPDAEAPGSLTGGVEFKEVAFAFHEGVPALCGVSLVVKPGQCIGIMGATGSGKSTLLSLIPRFYDATSGSVHVDGKDVRQLALDELRRQVGIVFQETLLFRDSVANNIAFGQPNATHEQIVKAAKVAGAHEFISALPEGYQTLLEEGAVNLSGGQRQRLAIARALLLEPPILILDDPTTAVDPETEAQVLSALDSAARGRTTLLISSRLATLRRADRIIVLDKGRIVQEGTHEQLLNERGPYAESVRVQGLDHESLRLLTLQGVPS